MVSNGLKRFEDELTYNIKYGSIDMCGRRIVMYYVMSQFIEEYVIEEYIGEMTKMLKCTYLDIISDK